MRFGVLGSVEASDDDREVRLGGPKQRALLAILLLHANEVVPRRQLIDGLWGERPPPSADHTLDDYISRLRKALGNGRLARRPPGYVLTVKTGELDLQRFELLLRDGQDALARADAASAETKLRQALALWRSVALADVADEPFAERERGYLDQKRVAALEARIEAELALGRSSELIAELETLVRENPFRERLIAQLMLALYRSGRQAEGLAVARAARHRFAEELGLEPGPSVKRLESAILEHDPSLDPDSGSTPIAPQRSWVAGHEQYRRRSRLIMIVAVLGVAAVLIVVAAWAAPGSRPLSVAANGVEVIDTRLPAVSAVVQTGGRPGGIAVGAGAIWETDTAHDLLLKIDPHTRNVERIPVGRGPTGVAIGGGEVWVVNQLDRTISEINPQALTLVASFQVGNGADAAIFADGSLWVANSTDDTLSRINPVTASIATIPLAGAPDSIAAGPDGLWVTSASTGQLLLVNPHSNEVTQAVPIGNGPAGVAVGAGAVWVANTPDGTVSRYDPAHGNVSKISVGKAPLGVAYGAGAVWVANSLAGTVTRIAPGSNRTRTVQVGNEPTSLALAGSGLWMTVLPAPASHRGGTLSVVEGPPFLSVGRSLDPAVFAGLSQWQMLSLTNDGLVTYRRADGQAGSTLVPDLATALPLPTNGGRTYTFRVRSGIRYSSGALVRAEDFRRAIERVLMLGDGYAQSFYGGIVGARRCTMTPTRCTLSGIVTDDTANTVTFNLTAPDPDFLYKLAFPMADAIPSGTPNEELALTALPATGPYMTQKISRSRASTAGGTLAFGSIMLVRNPRFREWSPDAQPDGYPNRIALTQAVAAGQAVTKLESGSIDVLISPSANTARTLAVRTDQLHSGPLAATFALVMNTHAAPFDRLAVRQALNYAIDRNHILDAVGGPLAGQPTCQILPPGLSGYHPYCPFTVQPNPSGSWSAPNLPQAKQLVRASSTRGMRVTLLVTPPDVTNPTSKIGRYVVSVLHQLGYRASLKTVADTTALLGDSRAHGQIGWFTWYQDYLAPSDFIDPLLTCRSFIPRDPHNLNIAEFCDPRIDAEVQRARAAQAVDPGAASQIWERADHLLTDHAAWVPLYNPRALTALSARVGNYEYHPFWQLLLDQLWVN